MTDRARELIQRTEWDRAEPKNNSGDSFYTGRGCGKSSSFLFFSFFLYYIFLVSSRKIYIIRNFELEKVIGELSRT